MLFHGQNELQKPKILLHKKTSENEWKSTQRNKKGALKHLKFFAKRKKKL